MMRKREEYDAVLVIFHIYERVTPFRLLLW